ncbi:hypothetical protein HMPREF9554_01048 [Treponema phagedenis F0421]|nr:hypothetical protein HMPREF9554_01048 [Treponema phagedenis F0421]
MPPLWCVNSNSFLMYPIRNQIFIKKSPTRRKGEVLKIYSNFANGE